MFRLMNQKIIRYHFNKRSRRNIEMTIALDANKEYDVCIDEQNTIYLTYQDLNHHIIFATIIDDRVDPVRVTEAPIKEAYYMKLVIHQGQPHIFYFEPEEVQSKRFRLYHCHLKGEEWAFDIVDEIWAREYLNPLCIHKVNNNIITAYYDYNVEGEQIYIKAFNTDTNKWGKKIKLTSTQSNKLYLDLIYRADKLHVTYCQFSEGNLLVKYERFNYEDGHISKEMEEVISNLGSQQDPTLIYYDDRLWICWIEHERIYSRYSEHEGNTWSPIYCWKESIRSSIVRYKYSSWTEDDDTILKYSFGKIKDDISFMGFGPLDNVEEVPLKKKSPIKYMGDLPEIRI